MIPSFLAVCAVLEELFQSIHILEVYPQEIREFFEIILILIENFLTLEC